MKVRSLRPHPYAGKYHAKNTEYEITSKSHLRMLIAVKAVEIVSEPGEPAIATVSTTKNPGAVEKEIKVQKGRYLRKDTATYSRKDMQAKSPTSE